MKRTRNKQTNTQLSSTQLWQRYQQYLCVCPDLNLTLDISRMTFPDSFFNDMASPMNLAYDAMTQLEAGSIANPDENRMVGHYWLRSPQLAPTPDLTNHIRQTLLYI